VYEVKKKELILLNVFLRQKTNRSALMDNFHVSNDRNPTTFSHIDPINEILRDGALDFWAAIEEEFPETKHQRCWVHKTANILDKMPKKVQVNAKSMIHEIYMSPRKIDSIKAFEAFLGTYESKFPKAYECLKKDREQLLAFYDFPAMHWQHLRTINPIESMFATVRHRTRQTKGGGSRVAALSMVFKLVQSAEKSWRKLKGHELIRKVIDGVKFEDGEEKINIENIA